MRDIPEFDSLQPAGQIDRRDFLAALAGIALAVQPVSARSMILTPTTGLSTGSTTVPTDTGALPIYFAKPGKKEHLPTVLVVQEIFGVHEYIKDVCRRLAQLGYLAVAPELFFRQGDPSKIENIPDILSRIVSKVPDDQVMSDLDATASWAARNGGDPARLAITGFCWGGRIVWLYAAHNPQLKAGVAWYGRLSGERNPVTPHQPLDVASRLKTPVLGLYGGKDQGIPLSDVEIMRAALVQSGSHSEIKVYPDAPHAFHADYRPSYRKAEAEDGWKRLQAWFRKFVTEPLSTSPPGNP